MSNNSWKQYGGIAKMEEYNVINANKACIILYENTIFIISP